MEIVQHMLPYIQQKLAQNVFLKHITRHMLGLFQSQLGARQWCRYLTENAVKHDADVAVVQEALQRL